MSTTFYVHPSTDTIPAFEELLHTADGHLNTFLRDYGIHREVHLAVAMRNDDEQVLPMLLSDAAWWPKGQYAWFHIPRIAGGTDAYARPTHSHDRDLLSKEVAMRRNGIFADTVRDTIKIGRLWYFRRSASQPAIISIAYGVLAASMAQLTRGFVYSDDGGWDYNLMPAYPAEFLSWYFRPELAQDMDMKHWAERCIACLPDELAPYQPTRQTP